MANVCIMRGGDGCFAHRTTSGQPVYHITDDGGVLCPSCANEHGHTEERADGWRIVATDVAYEDERPLTCDYCDEFILPQDGWGF